MCTMLVRLRVVVAPVLLRGAAVTAARRPALPRARRGYGRAAAALSDDEGPSPSPRTAPTPSLGVPVGFLGAGAMGEALLRGMISAGCVTASQVSVSVRTESRKAGLRALGVTAVHGDALQGGAAAVAAAADVVILATKPASFPAVLAALAPAIDIDRHLIISIAAGVTLASMERALPAGARVVRVMPNTPTRIGAGCSAYALGCAATEEDGAMADRMLGAVGLALRVDETLMDAVTGLSGCGPAYVFLAIEALADGGVRQGLPRDAALALAAHTVAGAARMVAETPNTHPALLREAVCSPGGATIVGLAELEDAGVRGALARAVGKAAARARELSGE